MSRGAVLIPVLPEMAWGGLQSGLADVESCMVPNGMGPHHASFARSDLTERL